MSYLEQINISFLGGTDIEIACTEAIELALKRKATVHFSFNGVKMEVDSFDSPDKLVEEFHKKLREPSIKGA